MANMDLSLGWRFRYTLDVPRSGVSTSEYNTLKATLQTSPGDPDRWRDNTFELMNDPVCGVAGPGLGLSAVEFNTGTRIQRAWSKATQGFVTAPNGFNFTLWFLAPTLQEGVLFALSGNKWHNSTQIRQEGSLVTVYDSYPVLKISLTHLEYDGSNFGSWTLAVEGRSVTNALLFNIRPTLPTPLEANRWYHLAGGANWDALYAVDCLFLNGEVVYGTDWSYLLRLPAAVFDSVCLADYNQITDLNGGVEGQGRFVGRIAGFGINFAKCVTTAEGSNGYLPQVRAQRQYWRGATFGSPLMRPQPTPLRALPFAGVGTLAQRWSGGIR